MAATNIRADALLPTADLTQTAAVYNDATRLLEGGLWQHPANQGNQTPTLGEFVADMKALGADAQMAAGSYAAGSTQATDLATIATLTQTLSAAATTAASAHGAALTAAETTLHDGQMQIQSIIANDTTLASASTAGGGPGFLAAPAAFAAGTTAATAPNATFADVGALFNDAGNRMLGGVNAGNHGAIQADLKAAAAGLQNLITNNPSALTNGETAADAATTLIHAQTIENQLNLQIHQFDNGHSGVDARGSNDNMLDIIDIVQGDPQLLAAATGNGANGFSAFGDYLHGTTNKFQDSAAQTKFWANFIVGANTLSTEANALVGSTDTQAINHLVSQIQHYEQYGASFQASQGGIFSARFANELGGHDGTLAADSAAMIKGLQTGNVAMVNAAGQGMIADAADVSGNNIPVNGGTFNTAGTTVAQVLSTAGTAGATAGTGGTTPATPVASAPPVASLVHEVDTGHAHTVFHPDHYWG